MKHTSLLQTFLLSTALMTSSLASFGQQGTQPKKGPALPCPPTAQRVATPIGPLCVDLSILDQLQTGNVDSVSFLGTDKGVNRYHLVDIQKTGGQVVDGYARGDASRNLHIYSMASIASEDNRVTKDEMTSRITIITDAAHTMGIMFQEGEGGVMYVSFLNKNASGKDYVAMINYRQVLGGKDAEDLTVLNQKGGKADGVPKSKADGDGNWRVIQNVRRALMAGSEGQAHLAYLDKVKYPDERLALLIAQGCREARLSNVLAARNDITAGVTAAPGDKSGVSVVYANALETQHAFFKMGATPRKIADDAKKDLAAVSGAELHDLYKRNPTHVSDRMQGQFLVYTDPSGVEHLSATLGCNARGVTLVMIGADGKPFEVDYEWKNVVKDGVTAINGLMMTNQYYIGANGDENAPAVYPSFRAQLGDDSLPAPVNNATGVNGSNGANGNGNNANGSTRSGNGNNGNADYDWMKGNQSPAQQIGAPPHPW